MKVLAQDMMMLRSRKAESSFLCNDADYEQVTWRGCWVESRAKHAVRVH